MFLLLTLALALASPPSPAAAADQAPDPTEPPAHEEPADLGSTPAPHDEPGALATAEDLALAAIRRIGERDYAGAELLLDRARQRVQPDEAARMLPEIAYHQASAALLDRRHQVALERYQALLLDYPGSHRELDARFHIGEVLGTTGSPEGALRAFRDLPRARTLDPADRAKLEILTEIWRLDAGERRRSGPLRRAVERAPSGVIPFYEARGIARLARFEVDQSLDVPLSIRKRKARRAIRRRTEHLQRAETLVKQTIALKEPEWILEGVLALVDGFERFGDAIVLAPKPPGLTEDQLQIYFAGIAEQVEALWLRALRYADEGRQLATRLDWTGRRADALEAAYIRLTERIEGG